jgi:hypothetical protein
MMNLARLDLKDLCLTSSSMPLFADLSEFGRLEKQFLHHLEQIDAQKKVSSEFHSA